MYKFYISGVLLPIAPSSLKITVNDKDEEIDLANGGTMSVLNQPGLTEYKFSFRVPNVKYPFAMYDNGYIEAQAFLSLLSKLKMSQKPFTFKVIRGNTYVDHRDINTQVSLVSYAIEENVENGTDFMVEIELKEYVKFMTYKEAQITNSSSGLKDTIVIEGYSQRDDGEMDFFTNAYYTVKPGETLQSISQMFFGSMNYAEAIAVHNKLDYTTEELTEGTILNLNEEPIQKIAEELDKAAHEKQEQTLQEAWADVVSSVVDSNATSTGEYVKGVVDNIKNLWGVLFR